MQETVLGPGAWYEVLLTTNINRKLPKQNYDCKEPASDSVGDVLAAQLDTETCILDAFLNNFEKRNLTCRPIILDNHEKFRKWFKLFLINLYYIFFIAETCQVLSPCALWLSTKTGSTTMTSTPLCRPAAPPARECHSGSARSSTAAGAIRWPSTAGRATAPSYSWCSATRRPGRRWAIPSPSRSQPGLGTARAQLELTLLQEDYVRPLVTLLSILGGTLGLWLGLSLLSAGQLGLAALARLGWPAGDQ